MQLTKLYTLPTPICSQPQAKTQLTHYGLHTPYTRTQLERANTTHTQMLGRGARNATQVNFAV